MARPKGYWVKAGVLGGIQMACVWGAVMWFITDGDTDQVLRLAPLVGLVFGIVFPITMAWLERRSAPKDRRDEDA